MEDKDKLSEYINPDGFNRSVTAWGRNVKDRMKHNAKTMPEHATKRWKGRIEKPLAQTVGVRVYRTSGVPFRIRFSFARHGQFLYEGVGRKSTRNGHSMNKVDSDYLRSRNIKRGYRKSELISDGSVRKGIDWYDVEIRRGIKWLAEYSFDYYGEAAQQSILRQLDSKFFVDTQYAKVKVKDK